MNKTQADTGENDEKVFSRNEKLKPWSYISVQIPNKSFCSLWSENSSVLVLGFVASY